MEAAIIFDCEFLAIEGSPGRYWCGPYDPDPLVIQIGAAKLSLQNDFPVLKTSSTLVKPSDRRGEACPIDRFLTNLTGITPDAVAVEGVSLEEALVRLDRFSGGADFWSWGKDELNLVAISCYVSNIPPILPIKRFGNACRLLLKAGMPDDDMKRMRSHELATYYDLEHPPLQSHNALDDALSVAYVLQHLLQEGRLTAADFAVH